MRSISPISFPPFELDPVNQCLWRDQQVISLRPKAYAVLHYLVERPGQLVTKEELLGAVWPESFVGDAVLKVSIGEVRKALQDDSEDPRFIETAHRRGYRFIGQMASRSVVSPKRKIQKPYDLAPEPPALSMSAATQPPANTASLIGLVGREDALAQMHIWLDQVFQGERRIVFVTGELGIGKTTLVEAFLATASSSRRLCVARGQCLEQYGQGEAYLPVLEALARLSRGPEREVLIPLLSRFAPTWLAQMPTLISAAEQEALRRQMLGATRERMLREMAEVVEALTAKFPLILVLEDLHWSDYSTLDLISALARRHEQPRLMLVGTYRPVELLLMGHPLRAVKRELQVHHYCEELPLGYFTQDEVSQYLRRRFPGSQLPADLPRLIYEHTDGHPLFMVNVVDYWLAQGWLVQDQDHWELKVPGSEANIGVPESLRQMIEKQIERLSGDQQQVLEAASIVGVNFAAAAVAVALEKDEVEIEECCDALVQQQHLLRRIGLSELPDGSTTTRFNFIHSLYANVLYQRVAPVRRMRLHQRIGERREAVYGHRVKEIAGELALHFARSRDYQRAVGYLRQAADNDAKRYANREAIGYLGQALKLVERLRETQQSEERMAVLEQLGLVNRSMGAMSQSAEYFGTLATCARQQNQIEREVKALLYLATSLFWIDRERCLAAVDQALELSRNLKDELLRAHTRGYCGHWNLCLRGWQEQDAQACTEAVEAARRSNDPALLRLHVVRYAYLECLRSEYTAAVQTAEEGRLLALKASDAFDYLLSYFFSGWALLHLGHWNQLQQLLKEAMDMAGKNGHTLWVMLFHLELAQLHEQAFDFESATDLCQTVLKFARDADQETGQLFFHSFVVLGFAHLGQGQYDQAFQCFNEVNSRLQREGRSMDWILHLPLHLGLGNYWLAQQKYEPARQEAEQLCGMAARPGERTYLGLGWNVMAEISLAEESWDKANAELQNALKALKGGRVPLAEWRVYNTAARLHQIRGQRAKADEWAARSNAIIKQLADSFDLSSHLRQKFLHRTSLYQWPRAARTKA